MSIDLSPTHKIERAKVHLDVLNQGITAWQKTQAQGVSFYDDVERAEYVIEIRPPDPDIVFSLMAGDFVSCLRSSLDHVVWHIAATATRRRPHNRICFPIYAKDNRKTQIAITKSTLGLPDETVALIRSLQPYNAENYKTHYLWILNMLWNIDKHRHIPLHSVVTNYIFPSPAPDPVRFTNFGDHAKVFFSLADKSKVSLSPSVDAQIIFGDESEGCAATIKEFRAIYIAVLEAVAAIYSLEAVKSLPLVPTL